jgi:hypothetical protein
MDIVETVNGTQLRKVVEVFTTTHKNEKGEDVALGIKVQNRYPAVGLALKQAAEKAATKQTHRGGRESHSA